MQMYRIREYSLLHHCSFCHVRFIVLSILIIYVFMNFKSSRNLYKDIVNHGVYNVVSKCCLILCCIHLVNFTRYMHTD